MKKIRTEYEDFIVLETGMKIPVTCSISENGRTLPYSPQHLWFDSMEQAAEFFEKYAESLRQHIQQSGTAEMNQA